MPYCKGYNYALLASHTCAVGLFMVLYQSEDYSESCWRGRQQQRKKMGQMPLLAIPLFVAALARVSILYTASSITFLR